MVDKKFIRETLRRWDREYEEFHKKAQEEGWDEETEATIIKRATGGFYVPTGGQDDNDDQDS